MDIYTLYILFLAEIIIIIPLLIYRVGTETCSNCPYIKYFQRLKEEGVIDGLPQEEQQKNDSPQGEEVK